MSDLKHAYKVPMTEEERLAYRAKATEAQRKWRAKKKALAESGEPFVYASTERAIDRDSFRQAVINIAQKRLDQGKLRPTLRDALSAAKDLDAKEQASRDMDFGMALAALMVGNTQKRPPLRIEAEHTVEGEFRDVT